MNELDELFARHTMRLCPNCGAQKIPACLLIHCAKDEFQGVSENGFGIKCNQCGALVILYNMKGLGFFPLLAALASPLFVLANINETSPYSLQLWLGFRLRGTLRNFIPRFSVHCLLAILIIFGPSVKTS